MKNYLNFEKEIKELDEELEKLKDPYNQGGISEVDTQKISKTQEEINDKLNSLPLFLICQSSIFFCKSSLNLINSLFFGASSSRVF